MKNALVVGGGSGIGLAIVDELLTRNYDYVYIAGKDAPDVSCGVRIKPETFLEKTRFIPVNLVSKDLSWLEQIGNIDTLIITAGFGRVARFDELTEVEVDKLVKCNLLASVQIIKKYYHKIRSDEDFYCAVMVSIAGHVASPLFSVYGAAKSGLRSFIENLNAELDHDGYSNRILDVSPGSLKGTSFGGRKK